ncbi:hypothetical protein GCM10008931_44360 [Oceanobacillus oncorhynchi subsp. oncorhynchi]|uniref:hypothetical protein n=1 Tax=Oceanobacillus oncorhynchi TaxID=545501 RepID=UPI0031DF772E
MDNKSEIISKSDYVLFNVKNYVALKFKEKKLFEPRALASLIKQWEFDYTMEKEFRPETLINRDGQLESGNKHFYEKTGLTFHDVATMTNEKGL